MQVALGTVAAEILHFSVWESHFEDAISRLDLVQKAVGRLWGALDHVCMESRSTKEPSWVEKDWVLCVCVCDFKDKI